MTKWVYGFGGGNAEGAARMKELLGGKGANLAEMANLGLPVPPGFTITTEVCTHYTANDRSYPSELKSQVEAALADVGKKVGRKFGVFSLGDGIVRTARTARHRTHGPRVAVES